MVFLFQSYLVLTVAAHHRQDVSLALVLHLRSSLLISGLLPLAVLLGVLALREGGRTSRAPAALPQHAASAAQGSDAASALDGAGTAAAEVGLPESARVLLANASVSQLEGWFRDYGELRGARRLARAIDRARSEAERQRNASRPRAGPKTVSVARSCIGPVAGGRTAARC